MSTKAKKTKPGDVRSMAYDVAEKIKDLPLSKLTNPVDRSLVAVEIFHDNDFVHSNVLVELRDNYDRYDFSVEELSLVLFELKARMALEE